MDNTERDMMEIIAAQKMAEDVRNQIKKKISIDKSNIFQRHLLIDTIYISQFKWSNSYIINTKYLRRVALIISYNDKTINVDKEVLCISPDFGPLFLHWNKQIHIDIPLDIINLIKLFAGLAIEWIFFS